MNKYHIALDIGERYIKTLLLKKVDGVWTAKDCHIGESYGIRDGSIENVDKLKECIRRSVYEVETSSKARADEISFVFSLENIVKIDSSFSRTVEVNGHILPSHIEDTHTLTVLNNIYTSFLLDETFNTINPIGLKCNILRINRKTILCSSNVIDFFHSIFDGKPKIFSINFANTLPCEIITCDIGYYSTRIRTKKDMFIISQSAKELFKRLSTIIDIPMRELEERVCISYLTDEEMTIVDECRSFFEHLFDEIFRKIYLDLHDSPKIRLCGLGCYVPFLCDFLMEYCEEKYGKKIEIVLVKPEINVDYNSNKNSLFFCNEIRKSI